MSGNAAVALLLKDELLIAMDVEMSLEAAGFDVTTVVSCTEALEWLAVCRPHVVIVDIILRDGPCHAVVEQLVAPFLVHSGDHPKMHADTVLSKGVWIGKPSEGADLVAAARDLVAAEGHLSLA